MLIPAQHHQSVGVLLPASKEHVLITLAHHQKSQFLFHHKMFQYPIPASHIQLSGLNLPILQDLRQIPSESRIIYYNLKE